MKSRTSSEKAVEIEAQDEHELLEQENFEWLADFRNALSPYWSSRLEYQAENKSRVLVLEGKKSKGR